MHKVRGLTRPNIEKYTSQNHAAKKPEKLVYKNSSQQRVDHTITEKKEKSTRTVLAATKQAEQGLAHTMSKPDIVKVTEASSKALMAYASKPESLQNSAVHHDLKDLDPSLRSMVNSQIFENKNNFMHTLVDPNNALFKQFRQEVLKEKPDAELSMNAIKKFSDFIHKSELELGKRFAIISSIDKKYDNASVFREKSPYSSQISASEYLQTAWEMTDAERSVFEIFSNEYVTNHLSNFENGNVSNMTFSSYSKFIKNSATVGRPGELGGRWVQPRDTIEKAFDYQKGNPNLSLVDVLTIKLGWNQDWLKNTILLALIDQSTGVDNLQMPTRKHQGANEMFFDSGHTHGTLELEAIAPVIEKDKLAIGIWGLPEDHALHPSNAKPGNYLEVEKFLSSDTNVEQVKRSMNAPLNELTSRDF
jgi:hypothetical protein